MTLFKAADEELEVEEQNVESRLREFILEDPDEFVNPDSEKRPLLRVSNGNCMLLFMRAARD